MRTCRASTDWRRLEQRTGQQQPERSHRIGSGGRALGIELEEPADACADPAGSCNLARAVPRIRRPRVSHPGCRTSRSPASWAANSRSFWRKS